jgi:hypothetical protein
MVHRRGKHIMSTRIRKISGILREGLACSARAVALREGLPWDPQDVKSRRIPLTRDKPD